MVLLHAPVLKYFDTVVRLGSIRKAAEQLNVASSAINRQLLILEDTLGARLFERLPRGVRLTPAGEVLIKHVRNTLRDFDVARSDIEDLKGLRKGNIVVAATEGVAAEFLPRVLCQFHKQHPGITFTVTVSSGDELMAVLRSNEADIGFMFNPPPKSGMVWGASASLRIGAVMKPDHPLARRADLRLGECQPYPVILPDITFPNRAWLDTAIAASALQFQMAVCSNSFQLMRELVKEGMGIAFQTTIGIEAELGTGELVYVPLGDPAIAPSVLVALVRAKQALHPAAAMFLDDVRRTFAEIEAAKGYKPRSESTDSPAAGRRPASRRRRA
jgi:DNA-binding transcriptional LysR family regulator